MPTPRPIRIGIIGCGNVLSGYRAVLDQMRIRDAAVVTRACGREPQRATTGDLLPGAAFDTVDADVIRDSEIDLVLILTSMPDHARLVRAALEAGKHVVVEKPLAPEPAEAQSLVEFARNRGRLLMAAPFTTLSPTFQTIARRIRAGEIGKVCSGRARYGWAGPSWTDWFYRPGGGCIFDLGVYGLTTLTGLMGPARRVVAFTGVAIPEREINGRPVRVEAEDTAQVLLDFGHGANAVVTTGFTLQQYRGPAIEVYGTEGTVQMLGDDWDPDGYELWKNSVGAWQLFKETAPEWPWTDGIRHAVECLGSGVRPRLVAEHAVHVIEIMRAAQESARTGRAIELRTTFPALPLDDEAPAEAAHLIHDRTRAGH